MKKIGKEVLFLHTGEGNPRNGEGTFLRLKDGRIMHAYTRYYGADWADHAIAEIYACYSADEGESWSEPSLLLAKDEGAENIMSPSLIRMANGDIGMMLNRKQKVEEGLICMPYFYRSSDEGKNWSERLSCGIEDGYYCVLNDGLIRQKNGRILIPLARHGDYYNPNRPNKSSNANADIFSGVLMVLASDDDGYSWKRLPQTIAPPFNDPYGLAEPGIYEYENGELMMWCRTPYGHQFQTNSKDNGESWSPISPNAAFTAPDSPMRIKRVGDYTIAVFNPIPYHCLRTDYTARGSIKRTPFVLAACTDDGRSFDYSGDRYPFGTLLKFNECCHLLEKDPKSSYCYPSVIEVEGGFLVAYYHSNGGEYTLNCTKITKVTYDELRGE